MTHQLESVAKAQPLLLHKHFKAPDGSVVAIQHEQGQGGELGCPVPAIAAVHNHRRLPRFHLVSNAKGSGKNELGQGKKSKLQHLFGTEKINEKWLVTAQDKPRALLASRRMVNQFQLLYN